MSETNKVVFLTDGVVILRPISKADLPFLLSCVNDPDVRFFIGGYLPQMEENEEKWLKSLAEDRENNVVFAIVVKEEIIGIMGIHNIRWKDRHATTGSMIKNTAMRGQGFGTRAKMLVLNYCFNELNLRKVCSSAIAYNKASLRFGEKCGYKEEGIFRKHIFKNGKFHDLVNTAVFRRDFLPLWKAHKKKLEIK